MFAQLTPEQAFELCAYHSLEPFGEVRMDFRFAQLQQMYLGSHRKKGTKVQPLASFTLYPDIADAAEKKQETQSLMSELGRFAEKSSG